MWFELLIKLATWISSIFHCSASDGIWEGSPTTCRQSILTLLRVTGFLLGKKYYHSTFGLWYIHIKSTIRWIIKTLINYIIILSMKLQKCFNFATFPRVLISTDSQTKALFLLRLQSPVRAWRLHLTVLVLLLCSAKNVNAAKLSQFCHNLWWTKERVSMLNQCLNNQRR